MAAVLFMLLLILLNNIDYNIDVSDWFGEHIEEIKKIYFTDPDYESNIYENIHYMSKNRFIIYIDHPFSSVITEQNNEYGKIGEFFLGYFKTLTDGNAESYNNYFTDSYFDDKNNIKYEKFTMQKIYDIEVEKLSESIIETGEYQGWIRYTFKVGYKIMANDGTFRSDMPQDTVVPQIIEILYADETFKINSIIKTKNKK